MSSFYDDASLVVIPSGYKTSKVYAEKPTDGSGDLTFTRTGDTATRVNSAGLIEEVRTNLVLQSNTFSTTWINSDSTETGGQAGYDGTNNAWLLTSTILGGFIYQSVSISGQTTFSVYAKAGSQNGIILYSVHTTQGRNFNLSTGAVGGAFVAAPDSSQIQSVGNGWYRCSITISSSSTNNFRIYVGDGSSTALGNVVIQNSQCEKGDVATLYLPTTTAAVSVGPVANVPRLDYLGSTCPRLILEPQRQNLITFSEQLNNATWDNTLYPVTITANQTASPSGYVDADLLTPTAASSRHAVGESASGTAGSVYTASAFFKKGGARYVVLTDGGDAAWHIVTADLDTATITNQTNATGTITNYGSGWYRVTCTFTRTNTSTIDVFVGASNTSSAVSLPSFNDVTLTTFAWGVSLELGAYATSYIPTLASASTRSADACSKTGISSLIGQTEGTVFVDFTINGLVNFGTPISVNNGTSLQYIWLTIFANGNLRAELYNGATQASITYSGAVVGGRYKMAFGYKTNDFVLYVNGAQVGTDNSGTTFSGTTLSRVDTDLTNASVYSTASESINQALLFTTRLTNAELATLTTL